MKEVINMNNKPIGVFDSGIGGVTVLDELVKDFPGENFIYVGDTLNLPYGTKTKDKLKELVSNVSNYLKERDVKAIVIACNTATANSHHLKDELSYPHQIYLLLLLYHNPLKYH